MRVTRCWSLAWSNDSLSHGIDKMADPVNIVDIRCSAVNVCPSRCDIYEKSAVVRFQCYHLVLIYIRKLQRSHSELSRVEQLSGLPSRLFFGLPTRFKSGLACSHRLYPT